MCYDISMSQGVPSPIPSRPFRKPTLCNQYIIDTVCTRLRRGGYPTVALEAEGLDASNHAEWLSRAQQDYDNGLDAATSVYCQYSEAVKRAMADAEIEMVDSVRDSATSKRFEAWLPAMTYLERRHPDRWGRREPAGVAGGAVQVQIVFEAPRPTAVVAPGASPVAVEAVQVIELGPVRPTVIDVPAREPGPTDAPASP